MRIAERLLVWGGALAILGASAGCGSKTEAGAGAAPAAISGGQPRQASDDASPAQAETKKPQASDPLHPVVEIQTSMGNIVVELDASQARLTVDNFLRYVESGHYDQTIFHQVLKDYVIMGGGYTPDLREKPTHPPIRNEAQRCGLKNLAGTIAMVRRPDVTDSATCQFYVNVVDNPNLDYKRPTPEEYGYCPFGKVISGMDVVRKIAAVEVGDRSDRPELERIPKQDVVIQSVRRVR